MSVRLVVVMSGLFFLLGAGNASAGTIAFDPFFVGTGGYTNNAVFKDQGPTNATIVGFTGKWVGTTSLAESTTNTVDAPLVLESGGSCRFTGHADVTERTVYRDFTEVPCSHGDTNYWSVIISLNGQDSNDDAYVTWRNVASGFMCIDLGIKNGRLVAGLRTGDSRAVSLDLGSYISGKAYHLVARAIISRGNPLDPATEDTTAWVNPTYSDIRSGNNAVVHHINTSFISPTYDHDRVEISTLEIGSRVAYFDEILYTTDIDDLNLSIQKLQSATFDPMPRPDAGGSYDHKITHDFDLDSITLEAGRYTDLEGPTNAWVTGNAVNGTEPANGETVTADEALTGLHVNAAGNITTAEVAFATTVTSDFPGGFFVIESNGDDEGIVVRPLDADGNPIDDWSLTLSGSAPWSGNLTGEENITALDVRFNTGNAKINGLAFTLGDFTGGNGVLTNVKGLQFVDSSSTFDPIMVGIYSGSAAEPLVSGSTSSPMTAATFNRSFPDNPITNDFAITGISTASRDWNSVEGTATANIHVYSDSLIVYPINGIAPANKDAALEGPAVNGVLNTGYYVEFMFANPVEDLNDRIFIIDDITFDNNRNYIKVRPLDADRFPISTHSLELGPGDWGSSLTPYTITYNAWGGSNTGRSIAGVTFGISDFAGGTAPVENVWGIRVESSYFDREKIDMMMVGRTKAGGTLILIH
ncbi:MAG: hypothetical protein PF904_15475 [Kiritimatiellae bacterium]|nr:hypothetical protein [Kiritimatiellia bacterium]